MIPGVLDTATRLWLRVAAWSAFGCIRLVDVWDWGGVSSGYFSILSLNISINVSIACV